MARNSHPNNLGDTVAVHVPDRNPAPVMELQFGHAGGTRLPPGRSILHDWHSVAVEHGLAASAFSRAHCNQWCVAIENWNRQRVNFREMLYSERVSAPNPTTRRKLVQRAFVSGGSQSLPG